MTEGRQKDEWDRMSHLLCMIYNANCAKSADCKKPTEFNPFHIAKPLSPEEQEMNKAKMAAFFAKGGARAGVCK